jgi:MFS transporter, DHA1 family, multidrug resistance protein
MWVLIALLFCVYAGLGLMIPSIMVLALEEHGPVAGLASALGGACQMVAGGGTIAIAGLFFTGTPLPMLAAIALCAVGAFVLSVLTLDWGAAATQAAE